MFTQYTTAAVDYVMFIFGLELVLKKAAIYDDLNGVVVGYAG
jgi:hypothetical protein